MCYLVTGASGHIGCNLVRLLLKKGERVRVLLHKTRKPVEGLNVEFVHGDITDKESITKAVKGVKTIFHCAGAISIDGVKDRKWLEKINVEGTRNMVNCSIIGGVERFVHFSSIHALHNLPTCENINEDSPLADEFEDSTNYARTKAIGERIVLEAVNEGKLDCVIINPCGVIGPFDYQPSLMGRAVLLAFRGKLPAVIEGGFNWVDVTDVAEGAIRAANSGRTGHRYILYGHYLPLKELFTLCSKMSNKKPPRFVIPYKIAVAFSSLLLPAGRLWGINKIFTHESTKILQHFKNIKTDKAERELSYRPRNIEQTLFDTYNWFIANGYLPRESI